MLEKRQEFQKFEDSWIQQNENGWVFNNNIFPGKKIFLPVQIKNFINDDKIKVSIAVNEKISTEFNIEKKYLFQKSNLNQEDYLIQEDISFMKIINRPEIFEYIRVRDENNKYYFFQGIDLFFINNFNKIKYNIYDNEFLNPQLKSQENLKTAIDWISNEKTLKPDQASLALFTASIIKNFMMTFEKQVVLLQGESKSGKSILFNKIINNICYYNTDGEVQQSVIKRQRTKTFQKKTVNFKLETMSKLSNLEDWRQTDFMGKMEQDIQSSMDQQQNIMKDIQINFCEKIQNSLKILDSFIELIDQNQQKQSAGVKVINLFTNDQFKFIGFKIDVKFFLYQYVIGKKKINFQIFYDVLIGLSQEELSNFYINKNLDEYYIVSKEMKMEKIYFQQRIELIKSFLSEQDYQKMMKIISIILQLGNFKLGKISKDNLKIISQILEVNQKQFVSFFKDEKQQQKSIPILMMILYQNLLDMILQNINNTTSKDIYHFKEYEALTIIDTIGFQDLSEKESEENIDNDMYSFYKNYINEMFIDFFNHQRFQKEQRNFKTQGLLQYYQQVFYVDNKLIIQQLNDFIDLLQNKFPLEKIKELLEKNDYELTEEFRTQRIQSDIGNKVNNQIYLIKLEQFFKNNISYDFNDIYNKNLIPNQTIDQIKEILQQSNIFQQQQNLSSLSINDSQLQQMRFEMNQFLKELSDIQVYFLRPVKLDICKKQIQLNQNLYNSFNSIDFESQIERFQKNYPYKLDYRYLIEKFNVITNAIKINPNLIIDYKTILEEILKNMFGENHQDKFLIGNDKLFMKADFFNEFDELLKEHERKENSRLLKFIDNTIIKQFKKHVDNSNKMIRISKFFLEKYAVRNQMEKWIRQIIIVQRQWQKIKTRKIIKMIINDVIDNLEYYNIKKVIKIQSLIRGFLCRRRNKDQIKRIKLAPFRLKVKNKNLKVQKLLDEYFFNQQIVEDFSKKILINKSLIQLIKTENQHFQVLKRQQAIKQILPEFVMKCQLIKYAQRIKNVKKIMKKIRIICLIQKFVKKMKKKLIQAKKRKKLQILQDQYNLIHSQIEEIQNKVNLNNDMKKFGEKKKNNKSKTPIKKIVKKCDINFCLLSLEIQSQKIQHKKIENFYSFLKQTKGKNEITNISVNNGSIEISLNNPNKIQIISTDKNSYSFDLQNKFLKFSQIDNGFLILNEDFSLDTQYTNDKKESQFKIMKKFLKDHKLQIFDFAYKNNQFLASSWNGELILSKNLEIPQLINFKRIIQKIGIGNDFFIIQDYAGVLYSSGNNDRGQLGIGMLQKSQQINTVSSIAFKKEIVVDFSVGGQHVFAVTQSGHLFCWGDNERYQLGEINENNNDCIYKPIQYKSKSIEFLKQKPKIQISCGLNSTYILTHNKQLYCLGSINLGTVNKEFEQIPLNQFNSNEIPISINIAYDKNIEIVYLNYLNLKNDKILQKNFQRLAKEVFVSKQKQHYNILQYKDIFADMIEWNCLRTKIKEQQLTLKKKKFNIKTENFQQISKYYFFQYNNFFYNQFEQQQ